MELKRACRVFAAGIVTSVAVAFGSPQSSVEPCRRLASLSTATATATASDSASTERSATRSTSAGAPDRSSITTTAAPSPRRLPAAT